MNSPPGNPRERERPFSLSLWAVFVCYTLHIEVSTGGIHPNPAHSLRCGLHQNLNRYEAVDFALRVIFGTLRAGIEWPTWSGLGPKFILNPENVLSESLKVRNTEIN